MGRPDVDRVRRGAQVVRGGAGEPALLRTCVSGGGGNAQYGAGAPLRFTERTITAMFAANVAAQGVPFPTERRLPGGEAQAANLYVSTDEPLNARDELVWRGTAYRIDGSPVPQVLGGRALWRSPLKLADGRG